MTLPEVRRILEEHGHTVKVDGALVISDVDWSRRRPDGSLESGTDWEIVPTGRRSLFEWLGY